MSMTLSSTAAAALVGNSNDLVYEILSRLPLTSVKRFRLVCKEWHSLATTHFFIDMHQNINHSPPCYVVQYFNNYSSSSTDYSLDDCTTKKSDHFNALFLNLDEDHNNIKMKSVRESINLTSNFSQLRKGGEKEEEEEGKIYYQQRTNTNFFSEKTYYHIELISSCGGFLLYSAKPAAADMSMSANFRHWLTKDEEKEEDPALILYNPVTKEKYTVTAPSSSHVYCGFYYHSPTKEHRILYQLMFDPHHHEYEAEVVQFLVFGLQTKSTRVLKLKVNNNITTSYHYHPDTWTPPVISNESLHWCVLEHDPRSVENLSCSRFILSFGIESEEFHTMPHPPLSHSCAVRGGTVGGFYRHKMNFLEMEGGILCLCDGYGGDYRFTKPILEIYVMEDYKKWTWIRRYRIDLENYIEDINKYRSEYKALQILQGDWLLLHFFHSVNQHYLLYSLNRHEDGQQFPSGPSTRMVTKCSNITKKRQTFQVIIDGFDKLVRGDNIYGRLVTRMIIKQPDKKWSRRAPSVAVGGNMVVLTPSLASLIHHNRTGTAPPPPRSSTFFSIRTNRSYEYID